VLVSKMGFFTDASTCWMLIVFRFVLGFGMGVLVPGAVVVLRPARHAAAHLMS
jgi:MFS family permease